MKFWELSEQHQIEISDMISSKVEVLRKRQDQLNDALDKLPDGTEYPQRKVLLDSWMDAEIMITTLLAVNAKWE